MQREARRESQGRPRGRGSGLLLRPPGAGAARVAFALCLLLAQPLTPATIRVTDDCTLVDAITAANTDSAAGSCPAGSGADVIVLTADVELLTPDNVNEAGPNGLPVVTTEVTIEGGDRTIARSSGDGTPAFRLFNVAASGELRLDRVTLRKGLIVSYSALGGGIFNDGTLVISNSTLTENVAQGVDDYGSSAGGAIWNVGDLSISNSTISYNSSVAITLPYPAFATGAGVNSLGGTLAISGTTFSNNQASAFGPSSGGGISCAASTGSVDNSTFSGNSAAPFLFHGVGIDMFHCPLTISSTTIAMNVGGAGIGADGAAPTLYASILAANAYSNCLGSITDGGGNLSDDDSCGDGFGELTGLDPVLLDNGGATLTHALLEGSSAIDAGGTCDLIEDQRGALRVDDCDSGAFEYGRCDDLVLADHSVGGQESHESCEHIWAGPGLEIVGPGGDLTLWSGHSVILRNGTLVESTGHLAIDVGPSLGTQDFDNRE